MRRPVKHGHGAELVQRWLRRQRRRRPSGSTMPSAACTATASATSERQRPAPAPAKRARRRRRRKGRWRPGSAGRRTMRWLNCTARLAVQPGSPTGRRSSHIVGRDQARRSSAASRCRPSPRRCRRRGAPSRLCTKTSAEQGRPRSAPSGSAAERRCALPNQASSPVQTRRTSSSRPGPGGWPAARAPPRRGPTGPLDTIHQPTTPCSPPSASSTPQRQISRRGDLAA